MTSAKFGYINQRIEKRELETDMKNIAIYVVLVVSIHGKVSRNGDGMSRGHVLQQQSSLCCECLPAHQLIFAV